MKQASILLCLLLLGISAFSQNKPGPNEPIRIGIFQHIKVNKLFIEPLAGKYKVKSDGKTLCRLKSGRSLILNKAKIYINVSNSKRDFGLHQNIEIIAKKYKYRKSHHGEGNKNQELNIKLLLPKHKKRIYQGNLNVYLNDKNLEIVNLIGLADYLAGVVEAESGDKQVLEYYKNQATICRTYALKNHKKHSREGFHLCDGVHCQAYKGKSTRSPIIPEAVKKTKDLVIVDRNNELITAVFSANCGGQTNNSEDVWVSAFPYLRSIKDTFCTDQRQAFWKKTISSDTWKNFLKEKSIIIPDSFTVDSFKFKQEHRQKFYLINRQEIKLTTLRYGLKLRSTFFSIEPKKNELLLSGRGYGHGVGMCQEGAMNMAREKFKFDEIIKYYYKGVRIVPLSKVW